MRHFRFWYNLIHKFNGPFEVSEDPFGIHPVSLVVTRVELTQYLAVHDKGVQGR